MTEEQYELPFDIEDALDGIPLVKLEHYLDKRKGKAILTPAKFEEWRDAPTSTTHG